MVKLKHAVKNIDDLILGCAIYVYSQQSFLKKVKTTPEGENKPRFLTDEELYDTMVGLLAKGYLYFYQLDDSHITIEPIGKDEKPTPMPVFEKLFKGKYAEMKDLQEKIEAYKEEEKE